MSSGNSAFSVQGATGGLGSASNTPMAATRSYTPNSAMDIAYGAPLMKSNVSGYTNNPTSSFTGSTTDKQPGLVSPTTFPLSATPSTAVKNHTVTGADGSVISTTYHKPESTTPSSTNSTQPAAPIPTQASQQTAGQTITDTSGNQGVAKYNPMTGQLYPGMIGNQSGGPNYPAQPSNPNGAYGAAIQNVTNTANQGANSINNAAFNNSQYGPSTTGAINNLNSTAGNAQQIANTAGNQISQIGQGTANDAAAYMGDGLLSPQAAGLSALITNTGAARQNAITNAANMQLQGNQQAQTAYNDAGNQAFTGQGQQIGAATGAANTATTGATNAAGLLAPSETNVQVPYSNQYINASTGQQIGGVSGNNLNSAVQTAMGLIKNNTPANDPSIQAILSPFGTAGAQALAQAEQQSNNGTYNPAAQSTAANTNLTEAANSQQQAYSLNNNLQTFNKVASVAQSFLQNNKLINPNGAPAINGAISSYMSQLNPAAQQQYQLIMNDAKALQSSIINSYGGTTPSANVASTLSTDPSSLDASELNSWLGTLGQLGQNQLSTLQTQTGKAYGSSGNNAYSGNQTSSNTNTQTVTPPASPLGSLTGKQAGQAAGGMLFNAVGDITGFLGKAINLFGL